MRVAKRLKMVDNEEPTPIEKLAIHMLHLCGQFSHPQDPRNQTNSSTSELIARILWNHSPELREFLVIKYGAARSTLFIQNEGFQDDLGNSEVDSTECHLHLPSLFTKKYGGRGFVRDRIAVKCATCLGLMNPLRPCQRCFKWGDDAIPNWDEDNDGFQDLVTSVYNCKCGAWNREDTDKVPVCCIQCCERGYLGKLYLD